MKGYDTSNGYMGYVEGKYILFASEQEYFEFMEDWEGGRNMSKSKKGWEEILFCRKDSL